MNSDRAKVRDLQCVRLAVNGAAVVTLSTRKSGLKSVEDHLRQMGDDFVRKVEDVATGPHFSVRSMPALSSDTLTRIFEVVYEAPYFEDGMWEGQLIDATTGALGIDEKGRAGAGNGNNVAGRVANTQGRIAASANHKKVQHKPDDVRSCCASQLCRLRVVAELLHPSWLA
jgi:hypothetical protein